MNRVSTILERLSVVVVWLAAAAFLLLGAFLGRLLWRPLPLATAAMFAAGLAAGRWNHRALLPLLIASFSVAPGLVAVAIGSFGWSFYAPWLAGIAGISASALRRTAWAFPSLVRLPLVHWALSVSLASGLVMAREADFTWNTLQGFSVRNYSAPVWIIVEWSALNAGTSLTLLLFLNWLFATYSTNGRREFRRDIIAPALVGWIATCAVAAYQRWIDPTYLSPGFWVGLGRTPGASFDANGFGALAAIGAAAGTAMVLSPPVRLRHVCIAAGLLAVGAFGVWSSDSRGALVILACAIAGVVWLALRALPPRYALPAGALAALFCVVLVWNLPNSGSMGRMRLMAFSAKQSPGAAARALWARDGYGTASARMIGDHPWVGVGIGNVHSMITAYSKELTGTPLPPDNAQSWYRHQLVELGVLGSAGWIAWTLIMLAAIVRATAAEGEASTVTVLRATLIGIGGITLVAMPTQDPVVATLTCILAFWFLQATDFLRRVPVPAFVTSPAAWAVLWCLVIAHAAGTAVAATRDLRVAARAARFDFDYGHGFVRQSPDSLEGWTTARRAVVVLPAEALWVRLTVWAEHPDANERPVDAEVRVNGVRVLRRQLRRRESTTEYALVRGPGRRFILEARCDRTFRPSRKGIAPERCLAMEWTFVSAPPH